jgi:hypothetical protein
MVPFRGTSQRLQTILSRERSTHVARKSFPSTCTRIERILGKPVGKIEGVFVGVIAFVRLTTLSWKR